MKKGLHDRQTSALARLKGNLVTQTILLDTCTRDEEKKYRSNIKRIKSEITTLEKRTK